MSRRESRPTTKKKTDLLYILINTIRLSKTNYTCLFMRSDVVLCSDDNLSNASKAVMDTEHFSALTAAHFAMV